MLPISRPVLSHTLIVTVLVGLSLLVSYIVPRHARVDADAWLQGLTPKSQAQLETFAQVQASDLERARLKDQLVLARERAKHHLTVAAYFFSNYYMAIIQAYVMGAVAAVALFFITKVGYAQASSNVVTVFITATVLATIYGTFPSVFRQVDNVAENKALYLRYIALQNEMLSYSATGLDGTGKKVTAAEYVVSIDKELNKANNVAVGFLPSKIAAIKFELK